MKKWIIFLDFNWVISHNRFRSRLSQTHKSAYEAIQENIFLSKTNLVQKRMKWEVHYRDIINIIYQKTLINLDVLEDILKEDCENMDIDRDLVDYLSKLDYYLILVTDNMDCFDKWIFPTLIKSWRFEYIWSSCGAGHLKADSWWKVFVEIAQRYNIPIKKCYLIDDSLKNCMILDNIWWNGIHFTSKETIFNNTLLK